MKKIRLGNDIHVSWEILRNGEPEDFTDKVVEVKLVHAQTFTSVPIEWSIEGNVIEFDFFGKDQKRKGEYRIILTENRGELGMSTLDACEAFYLVDHSCKESDGTKCPTLKVQHVRLTGSFSLSGSVVKPDVSGQIEEHNQDQEAHPFIQNKIAKVVSEALADYIKKETGKGLSTNDFTNELKARLENLTPYDPSELEAEIGKLKTTINTLVSGNASNAIESFNEIIAFLNSVSDTETLEGIIAGIINTVSKIEEKIPTKVSELEDDLSIVTLNDSTPLVESLVGNELIPIKQDGENKAVSVEQIKNNILAIPSKYEFVDLGLPSGTKWATCNVGANSPEESGLYFQWGDIQGYTAEDVAAGKKAFSWNDYKFGTQNNLTKYNATDGLTQLELVDDAAYQSDNTCRMPTKDEIQELIDNTILTLEILNGVNGRRFTSKTNGNSIFVPIAGYYGNGSLLGNALGCCWSNLLAESISYSFGFYFNSNNVNVNINSYIRSYGRNIRPVQAPNTPPTTINLKELKDKIEEAKEVFIVTSDMFEQTATAGELTAHTLTFTDEGWSDFIEAVEANKIIALDSKVCRTVILQATPMVTDIVFTEYFILAGLIYYPTEGLVNGFLSWVSQTEDSPATYVIIFSNKNVTSSVINTPSEIYYLDPNTYSTSEDFNNLKAAIEANKIVVININDIPTIAIPFTVDDSQIGLSFSGAIPDHFNVEDCLLQYGGYTCKSDGTITDITGDGANVLFLKNSGDGTKFLADDGSYKTIDIASILSRLDALEGK